MTAKVSGVPAGGGGGAGDVVGPASATDTGVASFDGTTGKVLKDSGLTASSGALGGIATATFTGGGVVSNLSTGNYRFTNTSGRGLELDVTVFTSLATYRKWAFPVNAADTFVGRDANQTLTNKTLTDPVFTGSAKFKGLTSSALPPSTTELPADKDFCIHKDTNLGTVTLSYNDGGVIKSVALV